MESLGASRITRKFQATVPKEVRKHLRLVNGDLLVFLKIRNEIIIKKGTVRIEL